MEAKFNLKEKSVLAFLREKLTNPDNLSEKPGYIIAPIHEFMHEQLLIKINNGVNVGDWIKAELSDSLSNSRKSVNLTYVYKAEPYDDYSIKLVLKDFSVVLGSYSGGPLTI